MEKKRLLIWIFCSGITTLILIFVLYCIFSSEEPKIPETSFVSASFENDTGEPSILLNAALVLEGGALRTLYTSGVLDVFMENNIEFSCVIGVSAGALNAGNYVAKEIGRSAKINILHSNDSNYFGLKQLLFKGSIFNFNYLFYNPIKYLYPYDENALANSQQRFFIGATDCDTGKIMYFERNNYDELVHVLQASSSIQVVCKPTKVDGKTYLDGAIADPIGVNKAFSEGYDKVVLVLTRNIEQEPAKPSKLLRFLYRVCYSKYPNLISTLNNMPNHYNSLINEINRMEQENKIFVIRPSRKIRVGNMEKDARKLVELYFQGRDDARELLPKMQEYINQ
jgi:predicted patatin/cPLA2 family phospholipase